MSIEEFRELTWGEAISVNPQLHVDGKCSNVCTSYQPLFGIHPEKGHAGTCDVLPFFQGPSIHKNKSKTFSDFLLSKIIFDLL